MNEAMKAKRDGYSTLEVNKTIFLLEKKSFNVKNNETCFSCNSQLSSIYN